MLKVYAYKGCGSCQKAIKFLKNNNIPYEEIAIRETPPSKNELLNVLKHYDNDIKKLFNVSGMDYRKLDLKTKLPTLSQDESIDLLHKNGNLVKRPFVISDNFKTVGFKEEIWAENLIATAVNQ